MATTPPRQINGSPYTPSTPRYGPTYDESPRRSSARLRQKRASDENTSKSTAQSMHTANTPDSPRKSRYQSRSPDRTPKRASLRRVQIISPTSDSDTPAPKPTTLNPSHPQTFLSNNTILNEGMLPTPVKTPNKKHKMIQKSNVAARALFQDQLTNDEIISSPKQNRKNKRFNGFSLETFRAEDGNNGAIQVFTDSRDQVPEVDRNEDNPFLEPRPSTSKSAKLAGTAKRRKVNEAKKLDPQVEEAIREGNGMVYVFRGKKVYRRFDDTGDEEEEFDAGDLGLLGDMVDGEHIVRPLKTLTRKSIKPTRLFQTEEQKQARELEKEEEAATDIEEPQESPSLAPDNSEPSTRVEGSKNSRRRTRAKNSNSNEVAGATGLKNGSPFDNWKRLKPGSGSTSAVTKETRGRKRAASPSFESSPAIKV